MPIGQLECIQQALTRIDGHVSLANPGMLVMHQPLSYENLLPKILGSCSLRSASFTLIPSKLSKGNCKNLCLLCHVTWLSAKPSLLSGAGGGSVTLVIKYAVDACAMPYIKTPINGVLSTTVNPNAKPNRTPSRSRNHLRFCSLVKRMREKYGSSWRHDYQG